jgi:hypothetical protein
MIYYYGTTSETLHVSLYPCCLQLKDLLDGAEAEAAASSGGGAAEAPAEQVAAQVEQLQVAEVSGDTLWD